SADESDGRPVSPRGGGGGVGRLQIFKQVKKRTFKVSEKAAVRNLEKDSRRKRALTKERMLSRSSDADHAEKERRSSRAGSADGVPMSPRRSLLKLQRRISNRNNKSNHVEKESGNEKAEYVFCILTLFQYFMIFIFISFRSYILLNTNHIYLCICFSTYF